MSTPDCTCPMTNPATWERYGGAIEPGSVHQPDPECRTCFTDEERAQMHPTNTHPKRPATHTR